MCAITLCYNNGYFEYFLENIWMLKNAEDYTYIHVHTLMGEYGCGFSAKPMKFHWVNICFEGNHLHYIKMASIPRSESYPISQQVMNDTHQNKKGNTS